MDRKKIYEELNCVLYKKISKDSIKLIDLILFSKPKPKYKKGNLIKLKNGIIGIIHFGPTWYESDKLSNWIYIYKHGFGLDTKGFVFEKDIIYMISK